MNVLTTEHKNLGSNPTKNDRAVTVGERQLDSNLSVRGNLTRKQQGSSNYGQSSLSKKKKKMQH